MWEEESLITRQGGHEIELKRLCTQYSVDRDLGVWRSVVGRWDLRRGIFYDGITLTTAWRFGDGWIGLDWIVDRNQICKLLS